MVSIVVSVYNEGDVIVLFFKELCRTLAALDDTFEIIFIDDGSSDNSAMLLDEMAHSDNRVKVIHFSRNFGHEAAMIAGIDHATGDFIICMDADLQNPPELIGKMLEVAKAGNDVICMVRTERADAGFFYRQASRLFYRCINHLSETQLLANASDFFLISSRVADALRSNYRERARFLRGIIQLVGFSSTTITYSAPARRAGQSKYSFRKLLSFSLTAIASFSKAPLKLAIYAGILFAVLGIILIIYSIVMWVVQRPIGGYTTLIIFISAFASILFFVLGIMGYYIGFIFDEVKSRPLYTVESIISNTATNTESK